MVSGELPFVKRRRTCNNMTERQVALLELTGLLWSSLEFLRSLLLTLKPYFGRGLRYPYNGWGGGKKPPSSTLPFGV